MSCLQSSPPRLEAKVGAESGFTVTVNGIEYNKIYISRTSANRTAHRPISLYYYFVEWWTKKYI